LAICHFFFSSDSPANVDVLCVEKDYTISKSFLFFFFLLAIRISVIGQKNSCGAFLLYACMLVACQINLPVCEPKWIGEKEEEKSTNLMVRIM